MPAAKTPKKKRDPYQTVGIPKTAKPEAVKRAYRRKAKATHPDSGGNAEEFKEVSAAYRLLTDESKRAAFDETGEWPEDGQKDDSLPLGVGEVFRTFATVLGQRIGAGQDPTK